MWPLLVIFWDPQFGNLTHLVERIEQMCIENLLAVGTVKPFDKRILVGLSGLDEPQLDLLLLAPLHEGDGGKLCAIVCT